MVVYIRGSGNQKFELARPGDAWCVDGADGSVGSRCTVRDEHGVTFNPKCEDILNQPSGHDGNGSTRDLMAATPATDIKKLKVGATVEVSVKDINDVVHHIGAKIKTVYANGNYAVEFGDLYVQSVSGINIKSTAD